MRDEAITTQLNSISLLTFSSIHHKTLIFTNSNQTTITVIIFFMKRSGFRTIGFLVFWLFGFL